jgi:hypothetical protein
VDSIGSQLEKLKLLERKLELKEGLPHLHGLKMYQWQKDYYNEIAMKYWFITAANQCGKSSIQIRKAIMIATTIELWSNMWPDRAAVFADFRPVIWYLYPNQDTVKQEVHEKWIPEFLPRGKFKDHPIYGWKLIVENRVIKAIRFNSGVSIYFKTYSQNVEDLQAGSCALICCDEELPDALYPELRARLMATQGYFSMVFTATIGQEFWRLTIQPDLGEPINFPNAFKRQVSLYDSKFYHDGTPSSWTDARIQNEIESCKNKQEVDRRIFGKFVKTDNKKYYAFDAERHYIPFPVKDGREYRGVPAGHLVYSAVDCGSGGENNHPAAFLFLHVNKDYTKIRVFRGRRMDKIETTAGDIYEAYKKSRGLLTIEKQSYDWAAKDFDTITSRAGDKFYKANKGHKDGEDLLNTLFKYDVLKIYQDVELQKLKSELDNLDNDTNKRRAKDDMVDVLRYAVMSIPVDWEVILKNVKDKVESVFETTANEERELRPRDFEMNSRLLTSGEDNEFEEWNELY